MGATSPRARKDEAGNAAESPRIIVDLARAQDEPELRRLLRENPFPGEVSLSLEREPSYFGAAAIEGKSPRTFVGRDPDSERLVGMGTRSARVCFVNGCPVLLPYLGALRVDPSWRAYRRYLAAAYDLCGDMAHPGEEPYSLTSIVADNRVARRFLEAGIRGLPTYTEVEEFVTLAIPTGGCSRRRFSSGIRRAGDSDLPSIVRLSHHHGMRHQFCPSWDASDFSSPDGMPGLAPGDFLIAEEGGVASGCLALWDQRPFKQAVVRSYSARLRLLRPFLNPLAPLFGLPKLPAVGRRIEHIFASHLALREDDPTTLLALLQGGRNAAAQRGASCILLGLARRNPLLRAVEKAIRHRAYSSILYLVHWPEKGGSLPTLDGRMTHVEVAVL